MKIKQFKDGSLQVNFTTNETLLLQGELCSLNEKFQQLMAETNGTGDDSEFPFILRCFATTYVGGILDFLEDFDEPSTSVNYLGDEYE